MTRQKTTASWHNSLLFTNHRPHTLTPRQLFELDQQITEMELELPRRSTDFEYTVWQVKDQLRQTRGIEAKLALNRPSTDDTRRLQYRVAQMRVFLEQVGSLSFCHDIWFDNNWFIWRIKWLDKIYIREPKTRTTICYRVKNRDLRGKFGSVLTSIKAELSESFDIRTCLLG